MTLPQINQDKANHFIYGFVIFVLANLVLNHWLSLAIVFLFASGKEIYDEWKCSCFDWKDLVMTMIPAIVLTLKNIYNG